jgi:hypothetical protein
LTIYTTYANIQIVQNNIRKTKMSTPEETTDPSQKAAAEAYDAEKAMAEARQREFDAEAHLSDPLQELKGRAEKESERAAITYDYKARYHTQQAHELTEQHRDMAHDEAALLNPQWAEADHQPEQPTPTPEKSQDRAA